MYITYINHQRVPQLQLHALAIEKICGFILIKFQCIYNFKNIFSLI